MVLILFTSKKGNGLYYVSLAHNILQNPILDDEKENFRIPWGIPIPLHFAWSVLLDKVPTLFFYTLLSGIPIYLYT